MEVSAKMHRKLGVDSSELTLQTQFCKIVFPHLFKSFSLNRIKLQANFEGCHYRNSTTNNFQKTRAFTQNQKTHTNGLNHKA